MCRDRERVKSRLVGNAVDNNALGWQHWTKEPTVIKPKDWPQLQLLGFMSKPDVLSCLPLCCVKRSRLFSLSHQLISWSQSLLSPSAMAVLHTKASSVCLTSPPLSPFSHSLTPFFFSVEICFCALLFLFLFASSRFSLSLPFPPLTARSSFFSSTFDSDPAPERKHSDDRER